VEFAVTSDGEVYILQVRPMTVDPGERTVDDETVYQELEDARTTFIDSRESSPFVYGDRPIYGVMPDWNPAEIIGRSPRLLADSLYRYLIMDEVWATQRAEFGYRDVRPHPLLPRQPRVIALRVWGSTHLRRHARLESGRDYWSISTTAFGFSLSVSHYGRSVGHSARRVRLP